MQLKCDLFFNFEQFQFLFDRLNYKTVLQNWNGKLGSINVPIA